MAAGGNRACRITLARLSRVAGHLYRCISGERHDCGKCRYAFAIATGNTLEALVGAWLVNRFAGGTNVFDRPQGVFKFALAAGISTIISPAFGLTSLGVAGFADWANYGAIWLTWWFGDATGDLVFTPLVLMWSVASKRRWNKRKPPKSARSSCCWCC
jgi:Predicted integral membrane sensor domain